MLDVELVSVQGRIGHKATGTRFRNFEPGWTVERLRPPAQAGGGGGRLRLWEASTSSPSSMEKVKSSSSSYLSLTTPRPSGRSSRWICLSSRMSLNVGRATAQQERSQSSARCSSISSAKTTHLCVSGPTDLVVNGGRMSTEGRLLRRMPFRRAQGDEAVHRMMDSEGCSMVVVSDDEER